MSKPTDPETEAKLEQIARDCLHIPTLETRGSDSLDIRLTAVWGIKAALRRAYDLGRASVENVTGT